jgi:putative SOS response-associated peptidase YedK
MPSTAASDAGIEAGEEVKSCRMKITEANAFVAEVHDRMPVLLGKTILSCG